MQAVLRPQEAPGRRHPQQHPRVVCERVATTGAHYVTQQRAARLAPLTPSRTPHCKRIQRAPNPLQACRPLQPTSDPCSRTTAHAQLLAYNCSRTTAHNSQLTTPVLRSSRATSPQPQPSSRGASSTPSTACTRQPATTPTWVAGEPGTTLTVNTPFWRTCDRAVSARTVNAQARRAHASHASRTSTPKPRSCSGAKKTCGREPGVQHESR